MRRLVLYIVVLIFSAGIFSPVLSQEKERQRRPRRPPESQRRPPDEQRAEPRRRPNERELRRYAVPRQRPAPRPHRDWGQYRRHNYRGRYYYSRPYFRPPYYRGFICVPGRWEYDRWAGFWVWVEGYCDVPRHNHHRSGFFFFFDFDF